MPQNTAISTSASLAARVQAVRTSDEVRKLIGLAHEEIDGLAWRNLGDRANNAGTVQIASSPALALVERVTNGFDGQIELAALGHPGELPRSPREAAREWFGMPDNGIAALSNSERRNLAEGLTVILEESGQRQRPTIVVTDRGIGQHPEDASGTLLSLNASNKVGSPYLHGAYGQGASATYRFAEYTVILTRRAPQYLDGRDDLVGWTVVWEDPGDPSVDKLPVYKYLVGPEGQLPTFVPESLTELGEDWHGVSIRHVAYELKGYTAAYNQPRGGVWALFHSTLFDPVFPFLIGGNREVDGSAAGKDTTRVVIGNAARLNNPGGLRSDLEIAHRDSVTFDVGKAMSMPYGSVRIAYWIVRNNGDVSADPTASFASPDAAVSMTLSGQRQDTESRAWLKANMQLPFLSRKLIVQIDVDGLSPLGKRVLFSSTRERAVDSDLRERIYDEVVSTLKTNDELKRLERAERDRMLAKSAEQVDDKIQQKLQKYIDTLLKNKTRKARKKQNAPVEPPPKKPGGKKSDRDTDDASFSSDPTQITFGRDPIRLKQGASTTVWVELDAKNGYLPSYDENLTVTFSESTVGGLTQVSRSELLGGKSLWKFHAALDTPLGTHELTATMVTPTGVAEGHAAIVVTPATTKEKTTPVDEPQKGPIVRWVREEGWADLGWDAKTVGDVQAGADETIIFVNRDQRLLVQAVDKNKKLSEAQIKRRVTRYLLPVACGIFEQHHAVKVLSVVPDEAYVRAEHERLASAVILAIREDALESLDD